jgi:hypothetical protein
VRRSVRSPSPSGSARSRPTSKRTDRPARSATNASVAHIFAAIRVFPLSCGHISPAWSPTTSGCVLRRQNLKTGRDRQPSLRRRELPRCGASSADARAPNRSIRPRHELQCGFTLPQGSWLRVALQSPHGVPTWAYSSGLVHLPNLGGPQCQSRVVRKCGTAIRRLQDRKSAIAEPGRCRALSFRPF